MTGPEPEPSGMAGLGTMGRGAARNALAPGQRAASVFAVLAH